MTWIKGERFCETNAASAQKTHMASRCMEDLDQTRFWTRDSAPFSCLVSKQSNKTLVSRHRLMKLLLTWVIISMQVK